MKILVLTRFVKEYEPVRLAEEGRKAGHEVDMVKYGQISLGVVEGKVEIDLGKERELADYDLIVPRAASKKGDSMVGVKTAVLEQAKALGIKILNGESFDKYPLLGKIEQGMKLAGAGLPVIDMLTFGSKAGWRDFLEEPVFDLPLIVKGRFGSHGRTVRLVKSWERLEEIFSEYEAGSVLVQPKVKVKQWYRCIVVKGKYMGEMRHRQKDKYGGEEGKLVKFNSKKMEELKKICLDAVAAFECEYAGLDVLWDEDAEQWRIIEVNRTAQFKYFEKRTGKNVAGELMKLG